MDMSKFIVKEGQDMTKTAGAVENTTPRSPLNAHLRCFEQKGSFWNSFFVFVALSVLCASHKGIFTPISVNLSQFLLVVPFEDWLFTRVYGYTDCRYEPKLTLMG